MYASFFLKDIQRITTRSVHFITHHRSSAGTFSPLPTLKPLHKKGCNLIPSPYDESRWMAPFICSSDRY